MSLWPCDWDECGQPAVQRAGDCVLCDRHLCRTHVQDHWHQCPKPETNWDDYSAQYSATEARKITELFRRINGSKLCGRASLLRKGIPSPEVFDWGCESDPQNPLGDVGYMLMEKIEGEPLDWQLATPSQKEKVMQQLVDLFLEIEKHPLNAIGSIMPARNPSAVEIQGFAYHVTFRPGNGRPLGPFYSSLEAALAVVNLYLSMVASGEIAANYPIDVYLTHRFRLDILAKFGKEILSEVEGQFFLKHPDDKDDHILVNEAYDIVGIIDWEWCHTVSKSDAFSSPCMMWPVAEFYDGSNELTDDELRFASIFRERGRDDLASYVTKGREVQRFFFALGTDSECQGNHQDFVNLFIGLKRIFGSKEEESWEEWKAKALEEWKDDDLLQHLLIQSKT